METWVAIVAIASPILTAIVALAIRGMVMRQVELRIDKLCRRFTDSETGYVPRVTFESRMIALEKQTRSSEVLDRLQELIIRMTILERRVMKPDDLDPRS